jgi:hypothetical protein
VVLILVIYLIVYGWTNIGMMSIILLMHFLKYICNKEEFIVNSVIAIYIGIILLYYLFSISWLIIGALLYFQTVESVCNKGNVIYEFSLALFIIQYILTVCYCCSNIDNAGNDDVNDDVNDGI